MAVDHPDVSCTLSQSSRPRAWDLTAAPLLFTIPNSATPKKSLPTHMNFWDCISTPLLQPGQQHNHLMLVNLFQVISSHFSSGSRATAPTWALSPPGTIILRNYYLHRSVYPFTPLNQFRYIHLSVNHSNNFTDPDSGMFMNTMEYLWALVKRKLESMCSTLYKYVPSYLEEFTQFRNFAWDRSFNRLLQDITQHFPIHWGKWVDKMAPLGPSRFIKASYQ